MPNSAAGLEAAGIGLKQMSTGINSIFNRYAQSEDEQNKQAVTTNTAMFEQRFKEANPEEQEALLMELSKNPQHFGDQQDELLKFAQNEPIRREKEKLDTLKRQNDLAAQQDIGLQNAAKPYIEEVNTLLSNMDYEAANQYLASNPEAAEAIKAAGQFDTLTGKIQGGIRAGKMANIATDLAVNGASKEETLAMLEQQYPGMSDEEKTRVAGQVDTMYNYIDSGELHKTDAQQITQIQNLLYEESKNELNDLSRQETELAAYSGITTNPELARVFGQKEASGSNDFLSVAEKIGGDQADRDSMANDLYGIYTDLKTDIKAELPNGEKISDEVLHGIVLDVISKFSPTDVGWITDTKLLPDKVKKLAKEAVIGLNEKVIDIERLRGIQQRRQEIQQGVENQVETYRQKAADKYEQHRRRSLANKGQRVPYEGLDIISEYQARQKPNIPQKPAQASTEKTEDSIVETQQPTTQRVITDPDVPDPVDIPQKGMSGKERRKLEEEKIKLQSRMLQWEKGTPWYEEAKRRLDQLKDI